MYFRETSRIRRGPHINRRCSRAHPVAEALSQERPQNSPNMWIFLCFVIAVVFMIHNHLQLRKKLKNYPPGPARLPLLGSLLSVPGELIHLHAEQWRKLYGNVIGLLIGSEPTVVVTGPDECLFLLKHEHCQARPNNFFARHRSMNDKPLGLMFSDGQYWSEQRRFTMRELRDRGFGKSSLEGIVLEEVKNTLEQMEEQGPLLKPNNLFNVPVLNVLWWMVSGKPFGRHDVAIKRLTDAMSIFMRNKKGSALPINMWPFLRFIAPKWSGYNEIFPPLFVMAEFLKEEIDASLRTGKSENSYMSAYLREVAEGKRPDFTVKSLVVNCFDMFIAGGESTANTLSFALMYLSMHPEVQAKVQKEMDAVVGRDRLPVQDDRPKLQYLEAVMSEVMRINPIAPTTVPHSTSQDVQINGYTLPKDTVVVISMYSVLHDKKHWGDPETFRPERFLDAEGRYVKNPLLVPFGVGKRYCLGEPLVHQTLFLFLAGLLSRFRFSLPPGSPKPSTTPESGFTVTPQPYEILAERRP